MRMRGVAGLMGAGVLAAMLAFGGAADAKTFRWANDGDVGSMDPYARYEGFLLAFDGNIYEPLVRRSPDLGLEPALATEWRQTAPDTWRFALRRGITFQDGSPFTAEDVLFSYERAHLPGSDIASMLSAVKAVRKVDDHTVEFVTKGADPILPWQLSLWFIMSKSWSEKNGAVKPADIRKGEEGYATRHANGTGPFMLKERQPDVKTVLVRNPTWWGKPRHNLDEVDFLRIANPATRVAALLSHEVDMIYTVPPNDIDRIARTPGLKVEKMPENRVIMLGLDVARDELRGSNVEGRNPLKDRRVRLALYQAIDEQAIAAKVMRGFAVPTALLVASVVHGYDAALDKRFPYDPAAAKKLLVEAGYPEGFTIGMDCPTDRYVDDEAICQAVASMLAKIGVKVDLLAQTRSKFFAKIGPPRFDTSFYLFGWAASTMDAQHPLLNLVASRGGLDAAAGNFNYTGYANPALDKLIAAIGVENDPATRQREITEALRIARDDIPFIPLHAQMVVRAMAANVSTPLFPSDAIYLDRTVVK